MIASRARGVLVCVGLAAASLYGCFGIAAAQTHSSVTVSDAFITPARLTATKGQPIALSITNQGSKVHNLVIPAFYIFTQNLSPGESVNVSFTPDKTGSFPYYSDAGGKPEPGLAGTITVAP